MTGDGEGRPADALARTVGARVTVDSVVVRRYDPDSGDDRAALWAGKVAFERELGAGGESDAKAAAYEGKLTDDYRDRYLAWVERCVASEPAVWLAVAPESADWVGGGGEGIADGTVVGYAFVLPERLGMIWDGAVLNELYVAPAARGTGVADALLGVVLERARAQDPPMDRLLLDVAPTNDRARAFYGRHGFEPWGEMVAREL